VGPRAAVQRRSIPSTVPAPIASSDRPGEPSRQPGPQDVDPTASSFPARPAEVVETHISTLFFVGERAYKRKKPVRFGFLDFSTAARRRAACHREVALNRRLAPTAYLGVADVLDERGRPDHLVVMRRMDPTQRLAALVHSDPGRAAACVDEVAGVVARFHASAERSAAIDAAATASAVCGVWDDSTAELAPFAPTLVDAGVLDEVTARYRRFLAGRDELFDARIAAGWVCDGHGDLQAEDVFCTPDGPQILDCIEFDDGLRHADVLADVAFLAMDLERLGAPDLARRLIDRWATRMGDPSVVHPGLLHHYVAGRAHVRAKVACLRAAQHPAGSDAAAEAATAARRLLERCAAHLRAAEVRLVLVGGTPGSGKTTLANALAAHQGWEVLHSDVVRRQRAGVAPGSATPGARDEDAGLYRPEQVAATYAAQLDAARRHLALGRPVVLDASWTSAVERARAVALAEAADATLVELRCDCDAAVARQRVTDRGVDVVGGSDATPEIADLLAARTDPWPTAVAVDTSGDLAPALAAALAAVGPVDVDGG
jgi:aminoglycoside phosphotransferase family enzyme/predicted kinase